MLTNRASIITVFILVVGLLLLIPDNGYCQGNESLGCCKTVEGTPACVGCGEGGLKCAIDGDLCAETDSFTLGEVCIDSELADEAECRVAESATGCCVQSQNQCSDGIAFESCGGQYWYDGAECSQIPECAPPAKSSDLIDWGILVAAIVIVMYLLVKFRRKKKPAA